MIESREKLMYDNMSYYANENTIKVYKVTNNCGATHLITFDWDKAWNKYIERENKRDYPEIEMWEVEV